MIDKQHVCFQSIHDYAIHIKEISSMKTIVEIEYNEVVTFIRFGIRGRLFVNNHIIRLHQRDHTPVLLKWYQFRFGNQMRPQSFRAYIRSMKALRADCTIMGGVGQTGSYRIKSGLNPRDDIIMVHNGSKCGYKNYSGGQDGLFKTICQYSAARQIGNNYCFRHHNYREYEFLWLDGTYKECEECGTNTIENFSANGLGRLISCMRPVGRIRNPTASLILIFKFTHGFVVYNARSGKGIQSDETPFVFGDEILINNVWAPL